MSLFWSHLWSLAHAKLSLVLGFWASGNCWVVSLINVYGLNPQDVMVLPHVWPPETTKYGARSAMHAIQGHHQLLYPFLY